MSSWCRRRGGEGLSRQRVVLLASSSSECIQRQRDVGHNPATYCRHAEIAVGGVSMSCAVSDRVCNACRWRPGMSRLWKGMINSRKPCAVLRWARRGPIKSTNTDGRLLTTRTGGKDKDDCVQKALVVENGSREDGRRRDRCRVWRKWPAEVCDSDDERRNGRKGIRRRLEALATRCGRVRVG